MSVFIVYKYENLKGCSSGILTIDEVDIFNYINMITGVRFGCVSKSFTVLNLLVAVYFWCTI